MNIARIVFLSGIGFLFSALSWCAQPAHATSILGNAGAGLQGIGSPSENLSRFWDGNSWDSNSAPDGAAYNPCNAGSLVIGLPCNPNAGAPPAVVNTSVTLPEADAGYRAWGNADGSADLNYGFLNQPGGSFYAFTMLGDHARLGR